MKYKNEILKYLSDLTTAEEKSAFEKELAENAELKKEYERFTARLNSMKTEIKADEKYFIDMSVKVRERLTEKKKKTRLRIAASVTAVAAMLLFFAIPKNDSDINKTERNDFVYVENDYYDAFDPDAQFAEMAESFSLDDYLNELSENIPADEMEEYVATEYSDLPAEIILENLHISESEIEQIYDDLMKEKFL